ncbi:MAG: DUF3613 domain-containing protein [Sulfuricella sp.]|nr:DUF3613 domain-containing protein [Sulfuricella sp.]
MNVKPISRIRLCGLAALCLSWSIPAANADEPAAVDEPPVVIGAVTEAILKLQGSGSDAGQMQPISGDVATRSYKRYLESFTRPIADSTETVGPEAKPATADSR